MNNEHLQKLLPFGYIYLVIMGIIKESIYFYQLDINILKYSSIMDILISPIADITAYPLLILVIVAFIIMLIIFRKYSIKNTDKKLIKKYYSIKEDDNLTPPEINKIVDYKLIQIFFFMILSFFLGIGIGGGASLSKRLANGKINYAKHTKILTFNSGQKKEIYLINTNSQYYFYVVKGEKSVEISPIGAIQSIVKK